MTLGDATERARAAGVRFVEEHAMTGDLVNALLRLMKVVRADLVVIGDRRQCAAARRLFGLGAYSLRARANTEVLIVNCP